MPRTVWSAEAEAPGDLAIGQPGRGELVRPDGGPDPLGVDLDDLRLAGPAEAERRVAARVAVRLALRGIPGPDVAALLARVDLGRLALVDEALPVGGIGRSGSGRRRCTRRRRGDGTSAGTRGRGRGRACSGRCSRRGGRRTRPPRPRRAWPGTPGSGSPAGRPSNRDPTSRSGRPSRRARCRRARAPRSRCPASAAATVVPSGRAGPACSRGPSGRRASQRSSDASRARRGRSAARSALMRRSGGGGGNGFGQACMVVSVGRAGRRSRIVPRLRVSRARRSAMWRRPSARTNTSRHEGSWASCPTRPERPWRRAGAVACGPSRRATVIEGLGEILTAAGAQELEPGVAADRGLAPPRAAGPGRSPRACSGRHGPRARRRAPRRRPS